MVEYDGGVMMIVLMGSSFIATLGFGILFNIKGYKLILAGIGGMIGSVVYSLALDVQISEVTALFMASLSFSLYSEILARICKTPVTTFIICSMIPLVPGKGMYETMKIAISGDAIGALQKGLDTITYAGSLALGIIVVSTIMRFLLRRNLQRTHRKKRTTI